MSSRIVRKGNSSSYSRTAQIVSRTPFGTGTVLTNAGGSVTSLGSYTLSSTGVLELRPLNMGWIADIAAHFAFWKLHWLRLVYVPTVDGVSTTSTAIQNPVLALGVCDDAPLNAVSSAASILELRGAKEFTCNRRTVIDYIPKGIQADWLFTTAAGSTAASMLRQTCAGVVLGYASHAGSFLSTDVGHLYMEYSVAFKGCKYYSAPTLLSVERSLENKYSSEERKSSKDDSGVAAKSVPLQEEYELVTIPLRRATPAGSGLGTKLAH